jgi:hypothetical protein
MATAAWRPSNRTCRSQAYSDAQTRVELVDRRLSNSPGRLDRSHLVLNRNENHGDTALAKDEEDGQWC